MKCPDCPNRLIPHGRGKNTSLLCNQCGKKYPLGSINKSVFWKTEIDRLKKPTPDAKAGRHVCTECNNEGKSPKCSKCNYSKTIHGKQQVSKPSQRNNKNYTILRSNEAFDVAWEMIKGDNAPTNPGLWSQAKSKARSKFKVYPSAYANAWASKWYKGKGGGWKKKGKKK